MIIHDVVPFSEVNGPGKRHVIWVQGCSRQCEGCFNALTHDKSTGKEISVQVLLDEIGSVDGITVSGGEPFEQCGELLLLLQGCKAKGLHTLVYTGYTFEELRVHKEQTVLQCLENIDLLIDGAYMKDVPPLLPWTGSGNQRLLELEKGSIVGNSIDSVYNGYVGEICIDDEGNIVATGIFDGSFL